MQFALLSVTNNKIGKEVKMFELSKLNKGGSASLSPKQIVFGRVNLMDARKCLSASDYRLVSMVFDEISKYKEKKFLKDFAAYAEMAMQILAQFDILVPYHLISGDAMFSSTADATEEREKGDYRAKAKAYLSTHEYRYAGDATWDKMVSEFYIKFIAM